MWRGILGRKIGMTQFFSEEGKRVGVTVVEAGPCPILHLRSQETDGYDAYQLGFDPKSEKASNKPEIGHAKRTGAVPHRFVREIRLREAREDLKEGDILNLESWTDVAKVQVSGINKGKGFQGVIKRHHFGGLPATHGVKTHHRHPGSIGSLTPARTTPGTKMPGQMGNKPVTQKGLKVAKVIPEKNLILIVGSVPGPAGAYILIRPEQPYVPNPDE